MKSQKKRVNSKRVQFFNHSKRRIASRPLTEALALTMKGLKLNNTNIALTLVDLKTMRKLNHKFRNKNRPTDVLSFSYNSEGWLGDVIISPEVAAKNAKEDGKTLHEELVLLAIHGLLHLLGYDHEKPKDAKKMFPLQDRWVKRALA